jgi:hypothetical protein
MIHNRRPSLLMVFALFFIFAASEKSCADEEGPGGVPQTRGSDTYVYTPPIDVDGHTLKISCEKPEFSLLGKLKDFKNMNVCDLGKNLFGDKTSPLDRIMEKFADGFSIGPCKIDIGLGKGGSRKKQECEEKGIAKYCKQLELDKKLKGAGLDKISSGLGNWLDAGMKNLGIFGGKATFGKKSCAGEDKKGDIYNSPSMKRTYGAGGYVDRLATDASIGGDPALVNDRKMKTALRCIETSIRKGTDPKRCIPKYFDWERLTETPEIKAEEVENDNADLITADSGGEMDLEKYWPYMVEAGKSFNLPPKLVLAFAMHESGLNPRATNPNTNGTTDYGLMQLNSTHFGEFHTTGEEMLVNVEKNVCLGAKVLADCVQRYGISYNGVNCYNKGPGGVGKHDGYVEKVMAQYQKAQASSLPDIEPDHLCENAMSNDPSMGDFSEGDAKDELAMAGFKEAADAATSCSDTAVHFYEAMTKKVPVENLKKWLEIGIRDEDRRTLIDSAYLKASEMSKIIRHLKMNTGEAISLF